ncbi:hypothetical protein TPHA_0N00100 [Tetrapisispora phaffii CBS 4417]|uniref:Uncharacterized protein n=1 Tax=Tetrapisispora phaffii (strain ATCC 24235 / CBS 4417 / NBRC 1672 / NRRL Y-8282 / UCD 70-5) TaxID=1071381 RepID=G8C0W4_TETPH|nr:hypothetical protein TPHA_0N00100 [Tetrapisispora phaffii CBS 4417]CCE65792.1 hypothetical protein TPHA_0N00100 [Tetrapisispora phaffii CBS 4417]
MEVEKKPNRGQRPARKFDVSFTVIKCDTINELYESIVIAGDGSSRLTILGQQLKELADYTRSNAPALLAIGNDDVNTLYVSSPFGMSKCKNKVYDRNCKTKKIDFEKLDQQIQERYWVEPLRRKTNTPKRMFDRRFADGTDHLNPIKSVEYLPLYRDDYTPVIFLKCSYENAKRTAKLVAIERKQWDDDIYLKFSPHIFYSYLKYPIQFVTSEIDGSEYSQLELCGVPNRNISIAMFDYMRDRHLEFMGYKLVNHQGGSDVILIEPVERRKDDDPHESIEEAPPSYDTISRCIHTRRSNGM